MTIRSPAGIVFISPDGTTQPMDRIQRRQIDELIGLCHGITADDGVNPSEVEFLESWLATNAELTRNPIVRALYQRVAGVLADGQVDATECADLLAVLRRFAGPVAERGELPKPTTLPFSQPLPEMQFEDRRYCFTGLFVFGDRSLCEQAVRDRGGTCGSLTRATNVLVVGAYASDEWIHSNYGTKIAKATEWQAKGATIAIVPEEHWTRFL